VTTVCQHGSKKENILWQELLKRADCNSNGRIFRGFCKGKPPVYGFLLIFAIRQAKAASVANGLVP